MVTAIAALGRECASRWRQQSVSGGAVSEQEIRALEVKVGQLPHDYTSFLLAAGRQRDCDRDGILFWAPEAIEPTDVTLTRADYEGQYPSHEVVIADYREESWWYSLSLRSGRVSLVSGVANEPQETISFHRFIEAYVSNVENILRSNWSKLAESPESE